MGKTVIKFILLCLLGVFALPVAAAAEESVCIGCHKEVTPNIVRDFLSGAMGAAPPFSFHENKIPVRQD